MKPLLVRTRPSAIHKQDVPSTSHLSVKISSLENRIPYYWGISHFTPLPMGEGQGGGASRGYFSTSSQPSQSCKPYHS